MLLMRASPASNPVSRGCWAPCRLPHTYIAAGHAAKATRPPSDIVLLWLMALAFDCTRAMLCWSLPMSTPEVAARGNSQYVSVARMWKGLVQIAFWSPGRLVNTLRRSEEHTSELHHITISYAVFC